MNLGSFYGDSRIIKVWVNPRCKQGRDIHQSSGIVPFGVLGLLMGATGYGQTRSGCNRVPKPSMASGSFDKHMWVNVKMTVRWPL